MSKLDEVIFLKVHQLQVELIKNTTKSTASEYRTEVSRLLECENIPVKFAQSTESINFPEFLIFPLLTALKKLLGQKGHQESSDINEILFSSITIVLNKIDLFNINLFEDILSICSILLSKAVKPTGPTIKISVSDEYYIASLSLISSLFQRSDELILKHFYQFKNLTTMGLLVSLSIDIILSSQSPQVRLQALTTLKSLVFYERNTVEILERIGTLFASFLPGISIRLTQNFLLAQNLKTLNHKLICSTLELLYHVISHVFNDELLSTDTAKKRLKMCTTQTSGKEEPLPANLQSLVIDRSVNKEWAKVSAQKLFVLIERLLSTLINHESVNVQLTLVHFCSQIADKSYFSLNDHLRNLLRVLVTFSASGDTNRSSVVSRAVEALKAIEQKELLSGKEQRTFLLQNKFSTVNQCLEEVLLRLPRLMDPNNDKQLDEAVRIGNLKTLFGYLKLVGTEAFSDTEPIRLAEFFYSNFQNVNKLLQALVACVHFDYKNLNNLYQIEEASGNLTNEAGSLSNYNGLSTYLMDTSLFEQLSRIVELLGRSDAVQLIIDQLLGTDVIFLQQSQHRCEFMFLINLLLKGLAGSQSTPQADGRHSIISNVMSNFLDESVKLADDSMDSNNNTLSTIDRNRAILTTCLTLEVISTSSLCLEKNRFELFLIENLYFALENYLSPVLLIRVVSQTCLRNLTINLGYSNIQALISTNYDYIMNDLILKSHNQLTEISIVASNDTVSSHIHVLCSLLDISSADLVPYLERLIDDYFLMIELQSENSNKVYGICQVMLHMARSMRKWYPVELNFVRTSEVSGDDLINIDLKELAATKKKPDQVKSFVETLRELDQSRLGFETRAGEAETDLNPKEIIDEDEEAMVKSMEAIAKDDAERTKEAPLHIKLQTKCMSLCVHLISHPLKHIRLQIIEIISELSRNLVENTNEFLPLVNNIWQPICQRFSLDDFIIKSKIMRLIFYLAFLSSDFISSRFCKEFLPRLCVFLSEQAKLSIKASHTDTTYVYSHAFKLQLAILTNLDQMSVIFEIKELELENLIESCILMYLDKRQPRKLQVAAVRAIKNCSLIDSDLIWLCLHYVMPAEDITKLTGYSRNIKRKYEFNLSDEVRSQLTELFQSLETY